MRKSMVLLLATTLAGCSLLGPGSPSDEQMAAADYGPRPSNDEIVLVAKRDALGHDRFTRGVVHVFVVGRLADVDIAGNEIRLNDRIVDLAARRHADEPEPQRRRRRG